MRHRLVLILVGSLLGGGVAAAQSPPASPSAPEPSSDAGVTIEWTLGRTADGRPLFADGSVVPLDLVVSLMGLLVLVEHEVHGQELWTSVDGRTWMPVEMAPFAGQRIIAIAAAGGGFTAFGEGPVIPESTPVWASRDGLAWERLTDRKATPFLGARIDGVTSLRSSAVAWGTRRVDGGEVPAIWTSGSGYRWRLGARRLAASDPGARFSWAGSMDWRVMAIGTNGLGQPRLWPRADAGHRYRGPRSVLPGPGPEVAHVLLGREAGLVVAGTASSTDGVTYWSSGGSHRWRQVGTPEPAAGDGGVIAWASDGALIYAATRASSGDPRIQASVDGRSWFVVPSVGEPPGGSGVPLLAAAGERIGLLGPDGVWSGWRSGWPAAIVSLDRH